MSIIENSQQLIRFIHFGCWNQGDCTEEGTNPLSRVMKKLRNFIRNKVPNFIIISGDNYYPIKRGKGPEKKKLINNNDLESGFNCLPKDIPIYLLLGNHDLDNGTDLKILSETGEEKDAEPCHILNEENKLIEKLAINRPKKQGKKLVMYKLEGNMLILMIDTTMYDMKPNKPNASLSCYDNEINGTTKEINETTSYKTISELMELQKSEIEEIINDIDNDIGISSLRYVVISGHHPLIYLKIKDNELRLSYLNNAYNLFYNTIFNKLKTNSSILYYYLCADLHNYQVGDIVLKPSEESTSEESTREMIIHQEIVGTGGTKLDMLVPENKENKLPITNENINGFTITYSMTKSKAGYGFIDCKVLEDKIDFIFIHSDDKTLTRTIRNSLKPTITRSLKKEGGKKTRKRVKRNLLQITR
jgi:predicted MPP superfamily phosphohydrolase